jgi:cation transport ATPase
LWPIPPNKIRWIPTKDFVVKIWRTISNLLEIAISISKATHNICKYCLDKFISLIVTIHFVNLSQTSIFESKCADWRKQKMEKSKRMFIIELVRIVPVVILLLVVMVIANGYLSWSSIIVWVCLRPVFYWNFFKNSIWWRCEFDLSPNGGPCKSIYSSIATVP